MKNDSPKDRSGYLTTPFEQVVSLCQAFTDETRSQSSPSISSYLSKIAEDARPTLFRNLLAFQIDLGKVAGHTPRMEDYLSRFPQFASVIRELFLELCSISLTRTQETLIPRTLSRTPGATRLGGYRLLGELGRGGMGVVYEAIHLQRGHRVALKTLPTIDGEALYRFKREFRALADVNHPHLIGLHNLEADGGQWFFTMDLLEGARFLDHVRPEGVLDEARLRSALLQLVTAVLALHSRHIIHRDLKPSNVMVTPSGHVVVLDFGLVLELDDRKLPVDFTEEGGGTPRYMAPEQAAGSEVTAASDWYAVGVMLYEALSGTFPFDGTWLQILQEKQRLDPPLLPDVSSLPADLAGLCMRMLARDPGQRPSPLQIAGVVASAHQPSLPAATPSSQIVVGRESQLAALHDAFRLLERQREPVTAFISGRSGEGKTTLAEHFLASLGEMQNVLVMSGRCYDRESVPFKALDTMIDALCGYLRSLPHWDAAQLMPDDIGVLAGVFPVLRRVEVVARASDARLSGLDQIQVRQRAFQALRSLLTRIARQTPLVWFIDDLQWGDADSAEAMFEVLRPSEAPAMLFLGSYRSDETAGSAFLNMWQELQRRHAVSFADREVKVGPLTEEECIRLVIGLTGQDNESVRRRAREFARETHGNPFLLTELASCFDLETDSFRPMPLHEVLVQKLGRLPAEAGPLLEIVAVSGQRLALEEATRAVGHEQTPMATLTRMRNERLVRLIGSDENSLIDTYHDRVRETVLDRMDQARRGCLHLALAEVIEKEANGLTEEVIATWEKGELVAQESEPVQRAYDLAYHFDAAGSRRKAWAYGLLAGEQARRQCSPAVAVKQFEIAHRNARDTPDTIRFRIAEGCGEALMLLGRYDDARTQLNLAASLTDDPIAAATVESYQAEISLKLRHARESAIQYEKALRRLGQWVPRSRLG